MSREEIERLVRSYVQQSINGQVTEHPKFDFKRDWYKLTELDGLNEFLKDTSAMANTLGEDGVIAIGFDDKLKAFSPTRFTDSGLKDPAHVRDKIASKADRVFTVNTWDFEVDGSSMSIVHVPPSIDKPHVVTSYEKLDKKGNTRTEPNRIFVRDGSSSVVANRHHIELMYYDRKNIVPEYDLRIVMPLRSFDFRWSTDSNGNFYLTLLLTPLIENMGRRIAAIMKLNFEFEFGDFNNLFELQGARPLLVKPSEIWSQVTSTGFHSSSPYPFRDPNERKGFSEMLHRDKRSIKFSPATVELFDGTTLSVELNAIA